MRFLIFPFLLPVFLFAQEITLVPDEMYFLDTKIILRNSAKEEITKSLEALKKNKAYYQTKLDRVDAYFPIIERVFESEGLPDDFKFLAIQESSLTSDAVSSSNAVGFWQFKREAALEHGLRVDSQVDERKNISASTRAAASYLKKSNLIFNNWIYSLQSYNVGLGGTQRSVDTRYYGAREMVLDGSTHWYILKCIAHKLAFADEEGKNETPPLFLFEYANSRGKSWENLAQELQVDELKLREYNKWLNNSTVPEDKNYLITVPASYLEKDVVAQKVGTVPSVITSSNVKTPNKLDIKPLPEPKDISYKAQEMYPGEKPLFVLRNGLEAIKAKSGDDINKLAILSGISRARFLKYNDLRVFDELTPNEYYYIEAKRNKATEAFHTVNVGESLRDVSQLYGITINSIMKKNRMKKGEPLQAGRELWLKSKRPENVPVKIVKLKPEPKKVPVPKAEAKPKEVYKQTTEQAKDTVPILPKPVLTILTKPSNTAKDSIYITPKESVIKPKESVAIPTNPVSKPAPDGPKLTTQNSQPTTDLPRVYYKDSIHVVQQKENLYSIARLYNTKPDSLKAWNKIDSTGLKMSQVLIIKKLVIEKKDGYEAHVVSPGETLYRIADIYKVSVKSIQEWNNKTEFTLSVGEVIFIKK
ncbi:MAG: LysM peptidoglycan-binding domain-containing protein [Opitutaceae bacterium]|nr:LysM peptidoglycan-binding domain-containing protein [Cytophagales bacterium]